MVVSLFVGRCLTATMAGHCGLLWLQVCWVSCGLLLSAAAVSLPLFLHCSMIACVALSLLGGANAYYGCMAYSSVAIAYFLVSDDSL